MIRRYLPFLVLPLVLLTFVILLPARAAPPVTFTYTSPRDGAKFVMPETTIAMRFRQGLTSSFLSPQAFHVVGSESGDHAGEVRLAHDGKTVIFVPRQPFSLGEQVTVAVEDPRRKIAGAPLAGGEITFSVAGQLAPPSRHHTQPEAFLPAPPLSVAGENPVADYLTVPDDYPQITVTVPASGTGEGFVFLASHVLGRDSNYPWSTPYLLILDNSGEPVYYKRMAPGGNLWDFKKQANGVLSYGNSYTSWWVMDDSYQVIDHILPGNGYDSADFHDFQLLDNGHALLIIYEWLPVDMSKVVAGGREDASVVGLVIQELDQDDNVVFQWRSLDYTDVISYTDSTEDLTEEGIDYMHTNAVELDHDGNLLISSRYLDEITKINRNPDDDIVDGTVMWRLGGKKNQFTFINDDEPFFDQHDIRRLPNGNITLFDNRTAPDSTYSRGVEYRVDEENKTAELVWQYRSDSVSRAMGNMQRLPNGNAMLGWGARYPTLTEVTPDGKKAFELTLAPPGVSGYGRFTYRAFRFPWEGNPASPPILLSRSTGDAVTLYISWNGATGITAYELYGSDDGQDWTLLRTEARQGFETQIELSETEGDYCYHRAMPLDEESNPTRYSNLEMMDPCVASISFLPVVGRPWSK